ncbi:MAG: AzlD domain-containing protein [Deltaproteobacteria bacterium]|nr:AzlD domain-containing protein [Candidatus Zymogenaceae bacterium]
MRSEIIITLVGMGIVTYLTRVLFIVGMKGDRLPPFVVRWLSYVPVAVLTAIICPMIAAPEKHLNLTYDNPYLVAGILTTIIAVATKNLVITVIGGMGVILLLKFLVG